MPLDKGRPEKVQAQKTNIAIESYKRLVLGIETIQDYAIFLLDPNGYVATWNNGAKRIKGYAPEEIIGQHFSKFYTQEAIDKQHPHHELDIAKNEGRFTEEGLRVRKDGSTFWANVVITALYDDARELLGFTKVTRDLTERKQMEDHLKKAKVEAEALTKTVLERSVQLEALNMELEAFAYSVSHDLRAPLRIIDGFSRILLTRMREKIDADERRYLSNICENSQRMGELIDALLKLSKLTRAEMRIGKIDLSTVAKRILDSYQVHQPERQVEVVIEDNLTIQGDAKLFRVMMENLLSNAWKFTGNQVQAKIEVGMTIKNGRRVYFIRDNGAGFSMEYAGKLFGAFQRLHDIDEFSGSGIGLATVQRIVNRHGGVIWGEGAINRGATFYFSLDKEDEV